MKGSLGRGLAVCALVSVAWAGMTSAGAPEKSTSVRGDSSALARILAAELERNFAVLASEPEPVHFLSYAVHDRTILQLTAGSGALMERAEDRSRTLTVDARAGDHLLDSTRRIPGDWTSAWDGRSRADLPLEDDDVAIRHAVWLETDRQFRRAVERLAKIRAATSAMVQQESQAPDFSREEPLVASGFGEMIAVDASEWADRLRRLSRPFASDPLIFHDRVSLVVENVRRTFVSSEGARVETSGGWLQLRIQAMTKAPDGMELPLARTFSARSSSGLPTEAELLRAVNEMLELLAALRNAPVVEPFSGPALLSGRAAAVFFHEAFGHRVEGHRQKDVEEAQTLRHEVGKQVFPPFISIVFDPTLASLGGEDLFGSYTFDDEGVEARRVEVVSDGVLRSFLMGRSPIPGFSRSNGHGRAAPGFRPLSRQSNLVVVSASAWEDDSLIERLREECRRQGKAFGLLFEEIEEGSTYTGRGMANAFNVVPAVVYRIHVDGGQPELVRGVDLIGTPLTAFGKIAGTGRAVGTFNGFCGAESGFVPVSASSPAILVTEVEVQKKRTSVEAFPILAAPPRRDR